ncbi:hypothetical protein [Noviherbaspirillum massiliense]|uniref:hypothetical protein n=1 Tax=Noviherbaspirillum massiliense TaxID=1465823 RepID=UPI00035F2404|nr:hypothetical protein [Noviherbaspirillum massiliense]
MSKVYIYVSDADINVSYAVIDLENLPAPTPNQLLLSQDQQGIDIAAYLSSDQVRAIRIVKNIFTNVIDKEAGEFLLHLARFCKSVSPSATGKNDWVVMISNEKANVVRVTPEYAAQAHRNVLGLQ